VTRRIALLLAVLALQACGSIDYVPEESAIASGRIAKLDVQGRVDIVNAQSDQQEKILYRSPTSSVKWVADYHLVTEKLIGQLKKEVGKNSPPGSTGPVKKMLVRVDDLHVENKVAFYLGKLTLTVNLEDGSTITKTSGHGSPGNIWHVLNRTVAAGVVDLLNDQKIRSYLAR